MTTVELASEISHTLGIKLSENTVIRRANEAGLFCRVACPKYFISEKNQKARLEFARRYIDKPLEFWREWTFSDESPYQLFQKMAK